MLIEPIEIAVTTIKIQLWGLVFARLSFPLPLEQEAPTAALLGWLQCCLVDVVDWLPA